MDKYNPRSELQLIFWKKKGCILLNVTTFRELYNSHVIVLNLSWMDFFMGIKNYVFFFKISQFFYFSWIHKLPGLWHHHKHHCTLEVTMAIFILFIALFRRLKTSSRSFSNFYKMTIWYDQLHFKRWLFLKEHYFLSSQCTLSKENKPQTHHNWFLELILADWIQVWI